MVRVGSGIDLKAYIVDNVQVMHGISAADETSADISHFWYTDIDPISKQGRYSYAAMIYYFYFQMFAF